MSIDETDRADAALTALSGPRYCHLTDEPLNPLTGQCRFRDHTHCPFCGTSNEDCPHLLATWNSEQGYEGPRLPMPARVDLLAEFSSEQKQQVLGEFFPLSAVYEEYAEGPSYPVGSFYRRLSETWLSNELLEWMVAEIPAFRMASWEPSGPGGACGNVCYAARPDRAREEMAAINDGILRAFETLLNDRA